MFSSVKTHDYSITADEVSRPLKTCPENLSFVSLGTFQTDDFGYVHKESCESHAVFVFCFFLHLSGLEDIRMNSASQLAQLAWS